MLLAAWLALLSLISCGEEPLPPSQPSACDPATAFPTTFRESALPWPAAREFYHSDGMSGRLVFPPSARSLATASFWLSRPEPFHFWLETRKWETSSLGDEMWVTLFIDGIQVTASYDGDSAPYGKKLLSEEWVRMEIDVPVDSVGPGFQHASVLQWSPETHFTFGNQFSLMVDDLSRPAQKPPKIGAGRKPKGIGPARRLDSSHELLWGNSPPDADGAFKAEVTIQSSIENHPCDGFEQEIVLVAVLDGNQIPVGGLGLRPRIVVSPTEMTVLRIDFRGLPVDGEPHHLQVWALPGYGRFLENRDGGPSDWYETPQNLINAWW